MQSVPRAVATGSQLIAAFEIAILTRSLPLAVLTSLSDSDTTDQRLKRPWTSAMGQIPKMPLVTCGIGVAYVNFPEHFKRCTCLLV